MPDIDASSSVPDRIVAMSCVLMADHCRTSIAIGDADLPEHRVARERGVVAAASHVGLDRRALPADQYSS